ncbi:hypothetical protein Bbelb_148490 [Branchiostoma belcheri]|nr:hypothetical protein Bbelb_148490 [Branchiostoma belcheri]
MFFNLAIIAAQEMKPEADIKVVEVVSTASSSLVEAKGRRPPTGNVGVTCKPTECHQGLEAATWDGGTDTDALFFSKLEEVDDRLSLTHPFRQSHKTPSGLKSS